MTTKLPQPPHPTPDNDLVADKVGYRGAEKITGLKTPTIQSYVSRRRIPHYRLGRRLVVFSRAELERWLEERKVAVERGSR